MVYLVGANLATASHNDILDRRNIDYENPRGIEDGER